MGGAWVVSVWWRVGEGVVLKVRRGVGTWSIDDDDHRIYMCPIFGLSMLMECLCVVLLSIIVVMGGLKVL